MMFNSKIFRFYAAILPKSWQESFSLNIAVAAEFQQLESISKALVATV